MIDDTADALDLTDRVSVPDTLRRTPLDLEAARVKLAGELFGVALEAPRIGRFRVLEKLGQGGMGEVYAAFDKELDRRIAIKVLRDASGADDHARMIREAQAMARLSHPNVVQVYEVGEHRGQIFIAMEFVKGATLKRWLEAEPRGWQDILAIFEQAGRGLHAAHQAGVVHRDFKPDNVLVGADARARVADFGLAHGEARRRRDDPDPATSRNDALAVSLTRSGALMGTPAFMSPEQYDGAATDPRTDQFSFCVALFEALYRQRPFAGATLFELAAAVHSGAVPEPPPGSPVPAWVHRALVTGLAPDPGHRHASMEVLLAELGRDLPGARDPWRLIAAALVLLLLVGAVAVGLLGRARAPTPEELEWIDQLTHQARDAAARAHWVYPPPGAPHDTAILRVVALEGLSGPVAARARDEADALRTVMAGELTDLGDTFWSAARPYARDFYAQALVFRPDHPRARERGGLTPGELADLRAKALHATFAAHELIAVEPLVVLASSQAADPEARLLDARKLARSPRAREAAAVPPLVAASPADPGPRADAPALSPQPDASQQMLMPIPRTQTKRPKTDPSPDLAPPPDPGERLIPVAPTVTPRPQADPDLPAEGPFDGALSERLVTDGDAALRRGDGDEARRLYHRALAADPRNPAALIGLSDIAFDYGQYGEAVTYAEKAVKLAPRRGEYRIRLGDAYFKVLKYTQAQRAYEAAAELGHPRAQDRLDRLRDKLGAP